MPAATLIKFEQFAVDVANKVHDLFGANDTIKAILTNSAPNVSTGAVYADITQIAAGNGYTTGGIDIQNDSTETPGGTVNLTAVDCVWTGGPAAMATFRYVVLYNDTPTSPLKPLIGYYDYGGAGVTVGIGETFTLNFPTPPSPFMTIT